MSPRRVGTSTDETTDGFSAQERAAMKERAAEVKSAGRRKGKNKAEEDAKAVLARIAEMPDADRRMAQRLHDVITGAAPDLAPRLWYGMPAYARDGKVLCFVQIGSKFGTRYTTLGFSDTARLDEGAMWPSAYALTTLGDPEADQVAALVRRAAG